MGHHFESDLAKTYPQLDLSDLYVFPAERLGYTAFVMCQNPKTQAGAADNLMAEGLYSFHIGFDRDSRDGITLTFRPTAAGLRVGLVKSANPPLGAMGDELGVVAPGATWAGGDGTKVWVGAVKDPFAGNALGLRAFKVAADGGVYKPDAFDNAQNFFEHLLTTAIVFELPNSTLPPQIHYSGTSAWSDHGHWHQVNRIGHVLLPHLYLQHADSIQEHMTSSVAEDATRHRTVASVVERYATLAGHQRDPKSYAQKIAERLLPDVVPFTLGMPASYSVESTNGRALDDVAMDVALHWLVGGPLSARVAPGGRSSKTFPYLVVA